MTSYSVVPTASLIYLLYYPLHSHVQAGMDSPDASAKMVVRGCVVPGVCQFATLLTDIKAGGVRLLSKILPTNIHVSHRSYMSTTLLLLQVKLLRIRNWGKRKHIS
jgi:hypothetical protein